MVRLYPCPIPCTSVIKICYYFPGKFVTCDYLGRESAVFLRALMEGVDDPDVPHIPELDSSPQRDDRDTLYRWGTEEQWNRFVYTAPTRRGERLMVCDVYSQLYFRHNNWPLSLQMQEVEELAYYMARDGHLTFANGA